MKILLLGAGNWGWNHLRTLVSLLGHGISEIYTYDPDPKVQEKIRRTYSELVNLVKNPDDVVEKVDGVVIATPAKTHYQLAKWALERNKHVLVEKPMALSLKEGEEIAELAEARNLILMVGHILLYHDAVEYIKNLLKRKELGDVYYLYAQRLNLGRIRRDENVLWSLGPHDFSISEYLFDSKPIKVSATGKAFVQPNVEDVVFVSVERDDGTMCHFHLSWLDPNKVRRIVIVGSKKMVVFDDMNPEEKIKIYDKGVDWDVFSPSVTSYSSSVQVRYGDIYSPKISAKEPLKKEHLDFIESVKTGRKPKADANNGLEVLKLLEEADKNLKNQ